jgi:hypothetical protein
MRADAEVVVLQAEDRRVEPAYGVEDVRCIPSVAPPA